MQVKGNLFVPSKVRYVRGDKSASGELECILCAIVARDKNVESLEICRTKLFCVCANLYPYNPGHLMVFPLHHVEDLRRITRKESEEIFTIEKVAMDILDEMYQPHGYNIGYNLGECGGNSIQHIHLHIVPRFKNELGLVDILSSSRIIVDDPRSSLPRLRRLFSKKLRIDRVLKSG
jgi:ATP adenylyltransferase